MHTYELFHAIGDEGSAAARRRVMERDLEQRVRFRNVVYPEVRTDLVARGGSGAPALWDGERLVEGRTAVLEALDRIPADPG